MSVYNDIEEEGKTIDNLGVVTPWGLVEPFEQVGWGICAWCGSELTEANDSGIDVFVLDGTKCQRICVRCNEKDLGGIKSLPIPRQS